MQHQVGQEYTNVNGQYDQEAGYNSEMEESKDQSETKTLREFLIEHKLQFLEQSLFSLGITMLRFIN